MRLHRRLRINDGFLWVDATGKERRCDLASLAHKSPLLHRHRDGVQVHHGVHCVPTIFLQIHELLQGAQIVAQMEIASWLDARENALRAVIGFRCISHGQAL